MSTGTNDRGPSRDAGQAVMRARRTGPHRRPADAGAQASTGAGRLDVNAVVSYNVAAIRLRRGWTQQHVADRLATLTARRLPQASISAMERGADGDRRRRFDAHELYLLSVVFDVPLIYFFLPPPAEPAQEGLADTGRPLVDVYAAALGNQAQQACLDERLAELGPAAAEQALGAVFAVGPDWARGFKAWRDSRLVDVDRDYGARLGDVAPFVAEFAQALVATGPLAYLRERAGADDGGRP